ncbi:hypothetical protein LSCM1_00596 [Leishmania martiniquensis]|uniref:SWIM-type domain-containing protein n=1 Tax=Leishmania martiniquensis TaxID=1580590 RepID=A0A836GSX8_9TRYP|nr:hypothetical protein LSCM1_00596 [Leishmania martiniquensis]
MEDTSRSPEEYVAHITRAVLDAYAQYITVRSHISEAVEPNSTGSAEVGGVPRSAEEALAPLEILYGKTALSAIGIALHGAEPIVRYVEQAGVSASDSEAMETSDSEEENARLGAQRARSTDADAVSCTMPCNIGSQEDGQGSGIAAPRKPAEPRGRRLYQVGEHTLFSPYYCPCSAYAYQSIQRQEVWCCKHLLALQLALRIEAAGVPQDSLRVRVVEPAEYEQLLLQAL